MSLVAKNPLHNLAGLCYNHIKMKKAAATRGTTTPAQDELDQRLAVFAARTRFIGTALNMGWQLALTVIVPVFIGSKLDDHFDSSPLWTLAALAVAVIGAVMVVASAIKRVSQTNDVRLRPNVKPKLTPERKK